MLSNLISSVDDKSCLNSLSVWHNCRLQMLQVLSVKQERAGGMNKVFRL